MFSLTCLLSLPLLALAREFKAKNGSVSDPPYGNFDMPIGALTSAWTHPIQCAKTNDSQICVFTNSDFNNGRGISILANLSDMAEIDWLEIFTKSSDPDRLNQAEGFHETHIPGKGMGLVADRNFGKGETLMFWTPILVEHDTAYTIDPEILGDLRDVAVERMNPEQQKSFLAQHGQWGGHRASDIMITNSFMFRSFGGLERGSTANFPEVSRFNHACRPNVGYAFDSKTLSQYLFATRTIHPGEELTISYINTIQSRHERIHELHAGWGFKCSCSHCSLPLNEIDESDQRIRRLREIAFSCEDRWGAYDTECGIDLAVEFVLLHQKEEITGPSMASAYHQAKKAAQVNGLDFLATKYGQLTLAEQLGDSYGHEMMQEDEQVKDQKAEVDAEDEGLLGMVTGPITALAIATPTMGI